MLSLFCAMVVLLLEGCGPRPPLTPAEKQDEIDYYNAICSVNPNDAYEQTICSQPIGAYEKAQKLRAYRAKKATP